MSGERFSLCQLLNGRVENLFKKYTTCLENLRQSWLCHDLQTAILALKLLTFRCQVLWEKTAKGVTCQAAFGETPLKACRS